MTIVDTKDTGWHLQVSKLAVKAISFAMEVDIFNSSVKQSMLKDWLPTIFRAYEEPLPVESVDNKRGFDSSNQGANGWISYIRQELYSDPSVEDIFVSIEDNSVDVWVVIPERDISVLRQLVEIEGQILEMLVSGEHPAFLFDFHIIYRCGRNIDELAPTKSIRLPR